MSTAAWGAVLGAVAGIGLLLAGTRIAVLRRPQLSVRVLPYLRDVPRLDEGSVMRPVTVAPTSAAAGIFGPLLRQAADLVERVLGGSTSVRRRLQRAGLDRTVQDFRIEQVVWGLVGFASAAAGVLLRALGGVGSVGSGVVFCALGFVCGVFLRDNRLTAQVKDRERQVLVEFPTVAELLALSVAAGESPVSALDRVVRRSNGALSDDLAQVLGRIRTGEPVGAAFESLARSTGLPIVARFATGITVAMERGTPLADVLHAQAADVREAGRRLLIETAARKEIAMMAPVVFFVLPVTILFAFYPSVLGLRLTTP